VPEDPNTTLQDLFGVAGKTAVVTGGSRGIGYMIADGLVRAGARVYISSRKEDDLRAAAAELSKHGHCVALPADLSGDAGANELADGVAEHEDHVDILVNNAGAAWGEPMDSFPEAAFDKVLGVNVAGVFLVTRAFLPMLRKAASHEDPARVINVGSVNGIAPPGPGTNNWSYSASKAGVHMLTRHLAGDLADEHITVNAIAPGPFRSKMMAFVYDTPEVAEVVRQSVPLKRHGEPSDMAGTVIYLSSKAGSYLTGAIIPVGGGLGAI